MLTKSQLLQKLLDLNSSKSPFIVKRKDDSHVEVTWNLVDAKWIKAFGGAGLKEVFRLDIYLDEKTHSAKYTMVRGTVTWDASLTIPKVNFSAGFNSFRGQMVGFEIRKSWGVKPNLTIGKLYDMNLNYQTIHEPIKKTVINSGWSFKRNLFDPASLIGLLSAGIVLIGLLVWGVLLLLGIL